MCHRWAFTKQRPVWRFKAVNLHTETLQKGWDSEQHAFAICGWWLQSSFYMPQTWRYRGFQSIGVITPSSHPLMDFPRNKPTSYWGTPWLWNPHMLHDATLLTSSSSFQHFVEQDVTTRGANDLRRFSGHWKRCIGGSDHRIKVSLSGQIFRWYSQHFCGFIVDWYLKCLFCPFPKSVCRCFALVNGQHLSLLSRMLMVNTMTMGYESGGLHTQFTLW